MNRHFASRLCRGLLLMLGCTLVYWVEPCFAMNKAELIDAIASESGLSKADAKRALDGFVSSTEGALKKGNRVALVGFGSWSVSRRGRNPQTGKEIKIAAKTVVKFKAGADLSNKVNRELLDKAPVNSINKDRTSSTYVQVAPATELGGQEGEDFRDPDSDGDGVFCYMIPILSELGIRRSVTFGLLRVLGSIINNELESGNSVEIENFGKFGIEKHHDGIERATFLVNDEFDRSVQVGLREQGMELVGHELAHVVQQASAIIRQVKRVADIDGMLQYRDLLSSANEMIALCDEYGAPMEQRKRFEEIRDMVMNAEADFNKFYDKETKAAGTRLRKDSKAAGTRVRKGMQELKTLAQDIRKEVQDKKNK